MMSDLQHAVRTMTRATRHVVSANRAIAIGTRLEGLEKEWVPVAPAGVAAMAYKIVVFRFILRGGCAADHADAAIRRNPFSCMALCA